MSFKLNLTNDCVMYNRNPNMRPQTQTPTKAKRDWVALGLMIAIGALVGIGLALAVLA